jgi:acyl-CoA synthetase (AMP-forming)/AMP-acid ligase II
VWATIECEHPTWLHTPAGFLDLLARHLRAHPPRQPSSLRFVRVTAAAISPEICDELERLLGVAVLPSYSSSEAGAIAATLPPPAPYKRGSTGRLVQEARIVDDAGRDVGPREAGEIWVRSPKLFAGYLDDPGMNAAAFQPDGWFRTGDVGYLDEDGFLFLTGRRNELINRGGAKISPAEVDAALLAHPAVRAAATFGVPDERLGEDIVAAVVLEDSAAVPSRILRAWLLDRLAPFKTPRRIWFVADLPRTASGKPQRRLLAERFLAAHAPPAAE